MNGSKAYAIVLAISTLSTVIATAYTIWHWRKEAEATSYIGLPFGV